MKDETELAEKFGEIWLRFKNGGLSNLEWQALCIAHPGLREWAKACRHQEMIEDKKKAHRTLRWR